MEQQTGSKLGKLSVTLGILGHEPLISYESVINLSVFQTLMLDIDGPQDCILSLCLFNLYVEHIMQNAGLDETKSGIKIPRRNINNLRYADDTTLMAESE